MASTGADDVRNRTLHSLPSPLNTTPDPNACWAMVPKCPRGEEEGVEVSADYE